jgi:hypothetical protein
MVLCLIQMVQKKRDNSRDPYSFQKFDNMILPPGHLKYLYQF